MRKNDAIMITHCAQVIGLCALGFSSGRTKNEVEILLPIISEVPHFVVDAEFNSAGTGVVGEERAPAE